MTVLAHYPLPELKLIYRLLHGQLPQQPDLLDSELLHELQTYLQQQASQEGVDISHHAQWARWLESDLPLKSV
ncbi:MAG: hypothetical protein GC149_04200 [Gammaproteobacteria bacterium]|nr:hypothetical protein [Gammaproteobacteria bacterium]